MPDATCGFTDAAVRCMAAARFGLTPSAFAALPIGEQTMCVDVDRVMWAREDRRIERLEEVLRIALGVATG